MIPHAAAVLLFWLAVLTFAFHHGCGTGTTTSLGAVEKRNSYSLPRKMLLAVASLDASSSSSSSSTDHRHQQQHHHHHEHHRHHRARWNRQGIPPSSAAAGGKGGEEIDPRYGEQKRLVPTGPNPLHH